MAVDFEYDGELRLGEPRRLFGGDYVGSHYAGRNWDVSPDGKRFFMNHWPERKPGPTEFVVVANWFDELKRIMESGRRD